MICVSISKAEQLNTANVRKGVLLELRFDLLEQGPRELMPGTLGSEGVIATCRPGPFSEEERIRIFEEAIREGATFVDIELDAEASTLEKIAGLCRKHGVKLIISWHDYAATPGMEELRNLLAQCYKLGADIAKIATMAHEPQDAARLLALYGLPGEKVIIGMGDAGKITRIAAPFLGASFTFAAPGAQDATAPGQYTLEEMQEFLNKLNQ